MGLRLFGSSSSYDSIGRRTPLPNPDPKNFTVLKKYLCNTAFTIKVKYHDCTNYEGEKILVFIGSYAELKAQGTIDPHFSDNKKFMSPFARFEPTDFGWEEAVRLVNRLDNMI